MLIVDDHKGATYVAASALALGLLFSSFTIASAEEASASPVVPVTIAASSAPSLALSITLVQDELETSYASSAKTVGAFLAERGITPADDDFISVPLDQPLSEGERLVYRPAVPVVIEEGTHRTTLRTSAATIADALKDAHVALVASDDVSPALTSRPLAHEIVRISHVATWTARFVQTIAQRITHRYDASLAKGTTQTLTGGRAGTRVVDVRYVRRDGWAPIRTVVATRVVRQPRPIVIAIGTKVAAPIQTPTIASVAQAGLASAALFAGSALHMIATAYIASCYGCSGITKMGMHAGLGVVAVDPSFIPLGTHLWIPGYGRAIAGDTGGAINGNRIDLGMNSLNAALQFGRRDITVYVIR